MNRELAILIRDLIEPLPFVDKVTGLVKTIEQLRTTESGKVETIRFPASLDDVAALPPGEYSDLRPDSSADSIFYLEDRGTRVIGKSRGGIDFASGLRLVGWMNQRYQGDALAIAHILHVIPNHLPNQAPLHTIRVEAGSILGVEDRIFSKYTYDEPIKQFLMHPYTAFAIDLNFAYSVSLNCLPEYV